MTWHHNPAADERFDRIRTIDDVLNAAVAHNWTQSDLIQAVQEHEKRKRTLDIRVRLGAWFTALCTAFNGASIVGLLAIAIVGHYSRLGDLTMACFGVATIAFLVLTAGLLIIWTSDFD